MTARAKLIFSHLCFETGGGIMLTPVIYSEFIPAIGDVVEVNRQTGVVAGRIFKYEDDGQHQDAGYLKQVNITLKDLEF